MTKKPAPDCCAHLSNAKRLTISSLQKSKATGEKLVMLTAYSYPIARILDQSAVHIILIGDSLGMTKLGYDTTIPVTMDDMCSAVAAVARGSSQKMIIADMPFLSFQLSAQKAVENAGRLLQAGAQAVKLEGAEYLENIQAIIKAGIPVMGHLGFTPQSVNKLGGNRVQARTSEGENQLIKDALALQKASVFGLVLEMVPAAVTARLVKKTDLLTFGIGAGPATDGQVLVTDDIIGLYDKFTPKFVKQYAQVGKIIGKAVDGFCNDVSKGVFPSPLHGF